MHKMIQLTKKQNQMRNFQSASVQKMYASNKSYKNGGELKFVEAPKRNNLEELMGKELLDKAKQ